MPILKVLKSRPALSNEDAARCVDRFAHMITQHGAPNLPRVPTVFQRFEPLHTMAFDPADSRTSSDWAQDLFGRIVNEARMHEWTLSCRLWTDDPQDGLHIHSLARQWHPRAPGTFAVDVLGNPVIIYREEWLTQPGLFAMHVIMQLATLRLVSGDAPDGYDPCEHALLVGAMAVYNGHGLELIAMADEVADHFVAAGVLSQRMAPTAKAHIAFLSVLCMATRRLAPEQMIASYGPTLTKAFRKSVWTIHDQVASFEPELKLMRLMSDGTLCSEVQQVALRSQMAMAAG